MLRNIIPKFALCTLAFLWLKYSATQGCSFYFQSSSSIDLFIMISVGVYPAISVHLVRK